MVTVQVSILPLQYHVCDYQHHFKNEETESQEVPFSRAHTATGGMGGISSEVCEHKPSCPFQFSYMACFSKEGVHGPVAFDLALPKRWMTQPLPINFPNQQTYIELHSIDASVQGSQ